MEEGELKWKGEEGMSREKERMREMMATRKRAGRSSHWSPGFVNPNRFLQFLEELASPRPVGELHLSSLHLALHCLLPIPLRPVSGRE